MDFSDVASELTYAGSSMCNLHIFSFKAIVCFKNGSELHVNFKALFIIHSKKRCAEKLELRIFVMHGHRFC
jgi:hypothetical protein